MSEEPTPSGGGDAYAGFIDKWRARWPEWQLAEVFLPPAERQVALAWAALQQELLDAAWGGTEARPGEVKLLWWQEELHGWSQGRRRHPLGQVLQRQSAPWGALAEALAQLPASRERAQDASGAFAVLRPVAAAAAAVEAGLFGGPPSHASTDAIAANWLATRALRTDGAAVPLQALARAGQGDATAAWRRELSADWPVTRGTPRARRLWNALVLARLGHAGAGPLPAWRVVWTAWRAARN